MDIYRFVCEASRNGGGSAIMPAEDRADGTDSAVGNVIARGVAVFQRPFPGVACVEVRISDAEIFDRCTYGSKENT